MPPRPKKRKVIPRWQARVLKLMTLRKLPERVTSWDVKGMTHLDPDIATGDRRRLRKT